MSTATAALSRWSTLQRAVLLLTIGNTAWAIAGLVANPSFATGGRATSAVVLGVDFNGWHAVSGLIVFVPGFVLVRRHDWTRWYAVAIIASLVPSGIWAMASSRPAGLWPFDHQAADAVLHLANAAVYAAFLLWDGQRDGARGRVISSAP